jgi:ABC-2 type transport system permease protein
MIWALLSSEGIKMRRAAPVRLAIAAPALLFVLELLVLFARPAVNTTDRSTLWADLLSFAWVMWLGLFVPVLIAFEAICLASIEHSGRHWKQLFTLPIPRWWIFAAKIVFCGLLVAVGFAVFAVTSVGGVLFFGWARDLHLAASTPWLEMLLTTLRAYLACWLLIVIHMWLSVRFPGFPVPAGIAFAALLIGVLLVNVSPDIFGWWYPWTLPMSARPQGLHDSRNTLIPAVFGGIGGVVLARLAAWDLGRRQEGV